MELEMLNVGWFTAPVGLFRAGDDMDRAIRFPVPAYVVETATERILIDTGLNPAAITAVFLTGWAKRMECEAE